MTQRCKIIFFFVLAGVALWAAPEKGFSQCASVVSAFPFVSGFETGDEGFVRNAVLHWERGSIVPGSKSVIAAAGNGQNCWIVGGLSGALYSSGVSYLNSPCFDFTTLARPELSLKLIWETERNFDGVHLEVSVDGGQNWQLLGSELSDANCLGENWYNNASVRFLSDRPGWSGSVLGGGGGNCQSGNGSGQWLTARHELTALAGEPDVRFRFVFGAGIICNAYEGFAFDDFTIREAPAQPADFTYSCTDIRTVQFQNTSSLCETALAWNFGDPGSGASNTSAIADPIHVFSAPGTYLVTLSVTYPNLPVQVQTATVTMADLQIDLTQSIRCQGEANGILTASGIGVSVPLTYTWNTQPPQTTASISGLSAGTYTVSLTGNGVCPTTSSATLTEPPALSAFTDKTDATCDQNNGSIRLTASGGTSPLDIRWNQGGTGPALTGLTPGTYSALIQDANGCNLTVPAVVIANRVVPVSVSLGSDTTICDGQTLLLTPGSFASYVWQDGSTGPGLTVSRTGTYQVTVTNNEGCTGTGQVTVTVGCSGVFFPAAFTPDNDRLNDRFGILGDKALLTDYELSLFDRWGKRLFSSRNPDIAWDGRYGGKTCSAGVYVWKARYRYQGKSEQRQGTILLLR